MINTDKYEGHTEGPWWADEWCNDNVVQYERASSLARRLSTAGYCVEQRIVNESPVVDHSGEWVCLVDNEADAKLIADAPLLLAEVKRLRGVIARVWDLMQNSNHQDREAYFWGFDGKNTGWMKVHEELAMRELNWGEEE